MLGQNREQLYVPRQYALSLNHKHLPEMQLYSGLDLAPIFTPIIGNYYQCDAVTTPLFPRMITKNVTAKGIQELLASYYKDERFIRVIPYKSEAYLKRLS
ncbi:hypothetical protein [Paenibacillus woosongensis]|uniref:hypothetical protein n=1 Tax=Paenibacillus woosongensis TaxID=307580 RepID=UPI0039B6EEFB